MPEIWKAVLALLIATLASVAGTVSIRVASDHGLLALAIVGGSLWSLSGAGFVYASGKGLELGVLAAAMSAGGILAINVIGLIFWGELLDFRKALALGLLVLAITLLAWSSSQS